MSDGVEIPYELLNELNGSLKRIAVEFDEARSRSGNLESAIGSPCDRTGLRTAAERFESEWDDKRETLKQDVLAFQERVDAIGQAWRDWDREAGASLAVDAEHATSGSGGR